MLTRIKPKPRARRLLRVPARIASKANRDQQFDGIACRHIQNHPEYQLILTSLQEGVPITQIASHFAQERYLTVTEKTFQMYLYVFKRVHRQLIYPTNVRAEDEEPGRRNIDRYVRGDLPALDVDRELDRALRFQKMRVGLGHHQERALGMPMKIVSEDMQVLGKFIELKAKRNGLVGPKPTGANQPLEKAIEDRLTAVKRDQEDHESLFRMAAELAEGANRGRE